MRNKQPVTQREYQVPAGATLMSTADTHSHITDLQRGVSSATGPSGNAYTTLLAINGLNQQALTHPSDDMRGQVQALQNAMSLFRLKS